MTDTKKYFSEILEEVKTSKIIGVFASTLVLTNKGSFSYMQDSPIYIRFDNGKCLIIDFVFIDELHAEYRAMTDEEQAEYNEREIKDCFNRCTDICDDDDKVIGVERSELLYGCLTDIEIERLEDSEYTVWSDDGIIEVPSTEETFCSIEFKMDNGKSFLIYPGSAEVDGYSFLWSNDAIESEDDA